MKTNFSTLALDSLRYSQVWEDPRAIEQGLDIRAQDEVLVISSGGGNVFNSLLSNPKRVYAVDLNPVQNAFLALQCRLIESLELEDYLALMGYRGPQAYHEKLPLAQAQLSDNEWQDWSGFFAGAPVGLALSGKLETYINAFFPSLNAETQARVRQLFEATDLSQQKERLAPLEAADFKAQFIRYFDRANLSKGRDIGLYQHSPTTGGTLFYERFWQYVQKHWLGGNFIAHFFFFGAHGGPRPLRPHFCTKERYTLVRQRLNRIERINVEAIDFLCSPQAQGISKAVLSNIFEYVSKSEFQASIDTLVRQGPKDLKLIFWNLLNNQGAAKSFSMLQDPEQNRIAQAQESCFYFGAVRVFDLKSKT